MHQIVYGHQGRPYRVDMQNDLGAGSYGNVYDCWDQSLNILALKKITNEN